MKQKTRFKNFGNIGIGRYISPWMANILVSASKKPYWSIYCSPQFHVMLSMFHIGFKDACSAVRFELLDLR